MCSATEARNGLGATPYFAGLFAFVKTFIIISWNGDLAPENPEPATAIASTRTHDGGEIPVQRPDRAASTIRARRAAKEPRRVKKPSSPQPRATRWIERCEGQGDCRGCPTSVEVRRIDDRRFKCALFSSAGEEPRAPPHDRYPARRAVRSGALLWRRNAKR